MYVAVADDTDDEFPGFGTGDIKNWLHFVRNEHRLALGLIWKGILDSAHW